MKFRKLLSSGWFWLAILLAGLTAAIFGYTWHQRQAVEKLVQEQVQAYEELVGVLQSIQDETTMKAAWPKLLQFEQHGQEIQKRFKTLLTPSQQFKEELARKYGPKMQVMISKYGSELNRIKDLRLPGGKEFWEQLESLKQHPTLLDNQGQLP